MTIVFDSTKARKVSERFGRGLAPANRPRSFGPSLEDRQWAAYHLNATCRDYCLFGQSAPVDGISAVEWDRRAEEAGRLHHKSCCE